MTGCESDGSDTVVKRNGGGGGRGRGGGSGAALRVDCQLTFFAVDPCVPQTNGCCARFGPGCDARGIVGVVQCDTEDGRGVAFECGDGNFHVFKNRVHFCGGSCVWSWRWFGLSVALKVLVGI